MEQEWRTNKYGGRFPINTNDYMNNRIRNQASKEKTYNIPQEQIDKLKNREDGNYYVAEIDPNDYLKITSQDDLIKDIQDQVKGKKINLNKINDGYMFLEVDLENGKVMNHEGRHRMAILKNNGYSKAQIIIMSKNNRYDDRFGYDMNSLHLTHQIDGEPFMTTLTDLKLINKRGD